MSEPKHFPRAKAIGHKTSHAAEPDEDGRVLAYCTDCDWREWLPVNSLSWMDAMTAIFAARDRHEADTINAKAKP
jgi:hypothetical protein